MSTYEELNKVVKRCIEQLHEAYEKDEFQNVAQNLKLFKNINAQIHILNRDLLSTHSTFKEWEN